MKKKRNEWNMILFFLYTFTYIQHYVQFDFYKYNTFSSSTLLSKITQGDKKYEDLDRIS